MICTGVLACTLAIVFAMTGSSGQTAQRQTAQRQLARPVWHDIPARNLTIRDASVSEPLAACEGRLERTSHTIPTLAIVGASYTAGVGPDNPSLSWAVVLARLLHWNAVVYGVSGAGYVQPGVGGLGPVSRLLDREGLDDLSPSVVIVQAGHDDVGAPTGLEGRQVRQAVNLIRKQAPAARIGLLTVFTGPSMTGTPALYRTDRAIVTAARAAYSRTIIMDPLADRWRFQHARGGLHPTAAGDRWIADKVAAVLRADGIRPLPPTRSAPVVCDAAVGVPDRPA